jgi:conjugative relaxase-like TrwC/TraI family protein
MAWMRMMGAESVAYHRETVMARGDDHPGLALAYYASRGETPLAWGGNGALRLGLDETVTDAQYEAVFGAGGVRDPTLGTRLTATRRPGVELVVSAHKSVALLGVIGRAEDMHRILDAETDATLGWLEARVREVGGRRGRDQTRCSTEGLVYARTRHATSRAGDPEPHDHVLIANVVEMLDYQGGFKALDTALIRDQLHAATMVGRVAAARMAVELGYAIEADDGQSGRLGHWRVAGIPQEVCVAFSKRSAEIDAAVSAGGHTSMRARGVAARDTRRAKRHTPVEDLMARWQTELESLGYSRDGLQAAVDEAGLSQDRAGWGRLTAGELALLAEQALAADGRLADMKVFTRADVVVALAPRVFGFHQSELLRAVAQVMAHGDAIPLVGVAHAREQAYAPACVIATEQAIAGLMERAAGREDSPVVSPAAAVNAVWAKEAELGRPLTVGQTNAAVGIATSGRGLDVVLGVAGSGKTTMLDAARTAFETAGYTVIGTATSGQAARTLGQDAHMEARTVASLLWRLDHERLHFDDRTVLVVDEAAMVDDPAVLRLLTEASLARAKVVLVGDHRQLGPVGPGGSLEGLRERHPDAIHILTDNVRQADHDERRVLAHLRAGSVPAAVAWYSAHDRVHPAPDRSEALARTVDAWMDDTLAGADTSMYAWRRANVAALNAQARERLGDAGLLAGPTLEVAGRPFAVGERIVTLAPAADGQLVTSQRGIVTEVHGDEEWLVACTDDGRHHRFSRDDLAPERVDYGYATTVHRAQGATVDTAHLYADGGGRELGYLAMSRARHQAHVHVVADDLDQACDDLTRDWTTERRQRWAIDTGTPTLRDDIPSLRPTAIDEAPRDARLRAERDAISTSVPTEHTDQIARLAGQVAWTRRELDDLERGSGLHVATPEGRAALAVRIVTSNLRHAEARAANKSIPRAQRRAAEHEAVTLRARLETAQARWDEVGQPVHDRLTAQVNAKQSRLDAIREAQAERVDWLDAHPEALPRLANIDRQLGTGSPGVEHRGPHRQPLELEPAALVPQRSIGLDLGF